MFCFLLQATPLSFTLTFSWLTSSPFNISFRAEAPALALVAWRSRGLWEVCGPPERMASTSLEWQAEFQKCSDCRRDNTCRPRKTGTSTLPYSMKITLQTAKRNGIETHECEHYSYEKYPQWTSWFSIWCRSLTVPVFPVLTIKSLFKCGLWEQCL